MKGSKILATIVAIAMVMSAMVVLNITTDFKFVENASATGEVTNPGTTKGLNLTCGEIITFKIVDNSLTYDGEYYLGVWNGTSWILMESGVADYHGDIEIDFHVPWWGLLGMNPLINNGGGGLTNGQWNIRLFNTSDTSLMADSTYYKSDNVTLTITNMYDVIFKEGSTVINHLDFNKSYSISNKFSATVRNYTGATYDDGEWDTDFTDTGDPDFDMTLYLPDGTEYSSWTATADDDGFNAGLFESGPSGTGFDDSNNYETFYWVNVSKNGVSDQYSNAYIPSKLNLSWYNDEPLTNINWGTTETFDVEVVVADGRTSASSMDDRLIVSGNNYNSSYSMGIYAPSNGTYVLVDSPKSNKGTVSGYYTVYGINPQDYSAGTWYIGTREAGGGTYRIQENEPDKPSTLPATFIPYLSFEVSTYEQADIDFRNSDEVISGFNQTINISVENISGITYINGVKIYDSLAAENFHITGLKAWNSSRNEEFDEDDIVCLTDYGAASFSKTKTTESRTYYEFTYRFNKTGTATVMVSYPNNITDMENKDSIYSDTYNNENLNANWTAQTSFDVASPGNLNMIVRGSMPSTVVVNQDVNLVCTNASSNFYIDFYGSDDTERVNATLKVEGCGLDFTIKQNDTAAENEYLMSKGDGWYQVKLEPKQGGTLSLTATNGSDTDTADFTIDGLTGSVTTSIGDDRKISVMTGEKITVEVKSSGGYPIETATVYISLFAHDWTKGNTKIGASNACINRSDNDDDVDGADGIYEFYPEWDTSLHDVGFLVCAAKSGGYWMYDVIEIEPIHDINITIINPADSINQTLTVGIDDQTLEVEIRDPDGNILEGSSGGSPTVVGYLLDGDHETKEDPVMTLTFEQKATQDKWVLDKTGENFPYKPGTLLIEVVNNTHENEHDGNISIPVELATVQFSPDAAVAGIAKDNVTVELTVLDALGNPVEDTTIYLNLDDAIGTIIDPTDNNSGVDLDENGQGEFEIDLIGNHKGSINVTFEEKYLAWGGNITSGSFTIDFPNFAIEPDTISTEVTSETILVTATDFEGNPLEGLNLTFTAQYGRCIETPDPVETDVNGQAEFDIAPLSSGKANVTIIQGLEWQNDGTYTWDSRVYTTDVLTITRQTLDVSFEPTKVYAGQQFTVIVEDDDVAVAGADVTYDGTTTPTNTEGKATFTASSPGIESFEYPVKVEKDGYPDASETILVIDTYEIQLSAPDSASGGSSFTVSVLADGSGLGGVTVTFNGKDKLSDSDGKVTFTAPSVSKNKDYEITATYADEKYTDPDSVTITIKAGGTPGFELLTLIAAIGIAFILLRRRRNK